MVIGTHQCEEAGGRVAHSPVPMQKCPRRRFCLDRRAREESALHLPLSQPAVGEVGPSEPPQHWLRRKFVLCM